MMMSPPRIIRVLPFLILFTSAASLLGLEATDHPGRISGTVTSAATGKPVAGAYVGIGDFGDAGGSNLGRFRKQGLYAKARTDQQGRFVLDGVAVPGEHPLVVTHAEFVRHDRAITLGQDKPEVQLKVSLKPGATIHVKAVDAEGNPLTGPLVIRLEALDGRFFLPPGRNPHLSAFASSVWSARGKPGAFAFTELEPGEYSFDVMRVDQSQAVYHGGIAQVEMGPGEKRSVEIKPANHGTRVKIHTPPAPPAQRGMPALVIVGRKPGLLVWYDAKAHSLEDPRLGRVVHSSLFYGPVKPGAVYTVENLAPGTYSVFAGPAMCLGAAELVVKPGEETTLDIPSVRPDTMAQVNLWRLRRTVSLDARAYTARELCELLTAEMDGRVEFKAHPAIEDETVDYEARELRTWDLLEGLYVEKGWGIQEEGRNTVILVPKSVWEKSVAAREGYQPDADPPPIALLYHEDAQVRIRTIHALAATADRSLIDDLIRAQSMEFYTPVHNAYGSALRSMTDGQSPSRGSNWKSWLAAEVAAGRLEIDYLPLDLDALDPKDRQRIQPLATRLGPGHFERMKAGLMAEEGEQINYEGLRYLVANDHLPRVQEFLQGDWLSRLLAHPSVNLNSVAYSVNLLANPGPLRDRINARVRACLDSENNTLVANTLHMLAGVEGYSTRFTVPGVEDKVRELMDSPATDVAHQARRAMARINPLWNAPQVGYEEAFRDLYDTLGREYPCFDLKGIDWKAVGEELLPRAESVETDEQFGRLCLELVARLEDSHAQVSKGTQEPPWPPFPRWDPGFACLIDDREKPVVYYVDRGGPAEKAGVKIGMTVLSINGTPAGEAVEQCMHQTSKYLGHSSQRYLCYQAARWFLRQTEQGATVKLETQDAQGQAQKFELPATLNVRYLPRLPVPHAGISDSANVSWTMLDGNVGWIYVRRIRGDLIEKLDQAVGELKDARGLIVDVRGNSGGGFDSRRSHRNFAVGDAEEPERPRFQGPIALLINARCISAGEGWASWFIANGRARTFGEATAGASSRKRTYTLTNGFYQVRFPVKAYHGFLDRPIERRGLEPDVPLRQNAQDLAAGRDTVLEAARQYLLKTQ